MVVFPPGLYLKRDCRLHVEIFPQNPCWRGCLLPAFCQWPHQKVSEMAPQVAWVWARGSTGQRELTTESCPLISALLPPSLTYTPVDYMCLDWFLRCPLFLWESCYFDYCSFVTLTSRQEVWFSFFIMYLLLGHFIGLCGHQVFFPSTPVKNLNGILQGLHWAMYCFG